MVLRNKIRGIAERFCVSSKQRESLDDSPVVERGREHGAATPLQGVFCHILCNFCRRQFLSIAQKLTGVNFCCLDDGRAQVDRLLLKNAGPARTDGLNSPKAQILGGRAAMTFANVLATTRSTSAP